MLFRAGPGCFTVPAAVVASSFFALRLAFPRFGGSLVDSRTTPTYRRRNYAQERKREADSFRPSYLDFGGIVALAQFCCIFRNDIERVRCHLRRERCSQSSS